MSPFLISACLLAGGAFLILAAVVKDIIAHRALAVRIATGLDTSVAQSIKSANRVSQWVGKIDAEIPKLLDQLGWQRGSGRALFFVFQAGVPVMALGVLCVLLVLGGDLTDTALLLIFIAGLGFLIPKRLLVSAVNRRKERLSKEVSTLIPLLRMLLGVGMTVEQALRVLMNEGRHILPELSFELRWVFGRVDAGLELALELREMAALLEVDDLTDCVSILDQLLRQGGGAMASLMSLKILLDDRRMTTLQEKVSKLSAKMSAVMVAFLFPALLIVLAGPGFVAIFKALGEIGG